MSCLNKILGAFNYPKNYDNIREVAEQMAYTAVRNGLHAALKDAEDFDELMLGFYFKIYIRIREKDREAILYGLGAEIANHVDMTDEFAMRKMVDVLTEKKIEFARQQKYEKAVAVRDQIGFLIKKIVELTNIRNEKEKGTIRRG